MVHPNAWAAEQLAEYASYLALTGGDPVQAGVYADAARAVGACPHDVSRLTQAELKAIPDVSEPIAAILAQIMFTGSFAQLDAMRAGFPDGVR